MRLRVAGLTRGSFCSARETVDLATPAIAASSSMVDTRWGAPAIGSGRVGGGGALALALGQGDADGGADARRALHLQLAAVHLDQRLGQRQTQARALLGLGVLALDLLERPGQPLQILGRDADAG